MAITVRYCIEQRTCRCFSCLCNPHLVLFFDDTSDRHVLLIIMIIILIILFLDRHLHHLKSQDVSPSNRFFTSDEIPSPPW